MSELPDEPPKATALPVADADVRSIWNFGYHTQGDGTKTFHGGFDFAPYRDKTVIFRAVADGIVTSIEPDTKQGWDGSLGARNYRILVNISKKIRVQYHFEVGLDASGKPLSEAEAAANILVAAGDRVEAGDPVGMLPWKSDSSHVDFGIWDEKGVSPSMPRPIDFFDDATARQLQDMYARRYPGGDICGGT